MKRLIPLVVFAVGSLFAAEPPRWLTISTLLGEREEEIAKDIRFLGKETIVNAVAFSCTLVPEGDPVVDKAALLAPRFRKMHELLKGSGVKEGILFQATMGHGWKPNSPAKGQKVIRPDGNEMYKFCPLDKTFLDYIAGQAKTIGELKPDYFMVDDDTRLITGIGGCFCPLHLQAISAKSGKAFQTRQELQAALKADAALRAQWDEVLRDGIAELMKVIRAQIPSEIPGEFCCCADDAHHAGLMAQLLAAPGQQPVVRINNARYMLDGRRDFMDTLAKTSAQISDLPAEIRRLADDGSWRPVVFTRDGNRLVLDTKAETLRPAVLAFTTPKACAPAPLYGVCAHVTRSEGSPARLKGTLDAMEAAGLRYVRSDIDPVVYAQVLKAADEDGSRRKRPVRRFRCPVEERPQLRTGAFHGHLWGGEGVSRFRDESPCMAFSQGVGHDARRPARGGTNGRVGALHRRP